MSFLPHPPTHSSVIFDRWLTQLWTVRILYNLLLFARNFLCSLPDTHPPTQPFPPSPWLRCYKIQRHKSTQRIQSRRTNTGQGSQWPWGTLRILRLQCLHCPTIEFQPQHNVPALKLFPNFLGTGTGQSSVCLSVYLQIMDMDQEEVHNGRGTTYQHFVANFPKLLLDALSVFAGELLFF